MNLHKKLIIFLLLFIHCGDSNEYIQNIYVDIEIDLSLPEFSTLNTAGNSMFLEGGNKGIIIYRYSNSKFKIYDRNCSYEPSLSCSYIDSINSFVAWCGCCSSAFLLDQNGMAINSPAIFPLKQYNYSISNTILNIYN